MCMNETITVSVMSFNMRNSYAKDGANCFENRKPRIKEALDQYAPDLIGFQEITLAMREWLVATFPQYYMVGAGRNADYSGECSLIAFKKDLFDLISADTVMLSSAPAVMGSRYEGSDQSDCPRAYTRVLLKHRSAKEPLCFYNVHTDHIGEVARILSSQQMLQDIASHGYRFLLTGDLNATPDAASIKMLAGNTVRPMNDVSAALGDTFHGYGKVEGMKIDYIFASPEFAVKTCERLEDQPVGGVYISDHYPIAATLEME